MKQITITDAKSFLEAVSRGKSASDMGVTEEEFRRMLEKHLNGVSHDEEDEPLEEEEEEEPYVETEEERKKREAREKARLEREAESQKVLDRIAAHALVVEEEERNRKPEPEPERPETFGSWV